MVVLFLLFMGLSALNAGSSEALLEGAVNRYVYVKTSTGIDGYDINEAVVEYVGIKDGPKEVGGGFKYCATFKRGSDYYDVDFYIAEKNGTYNVVKESLHKRNDRHVNNTLWEAGSTQLSFNSQEDLPLEESKRIAAVIAE